MSEKENLEAGITAIKSGNMPRAASFFATVVKENPASEQGWFLLGMSCSTPEQREYCLQRVLVLNPNHSEARKQLGQSKPSAQQSIPPTIVTNDPKPLTPIATPLIKEVQKSIPKNNPIDEQPAPLSNKSEKRKPKKKKSNLILIASSLAVTTLIVCSLGAAYIFLSPQMTLGTSPTVPALIPTASQTSTAFVVASPTLTLVPPTPIPSPIPTVVYTPRFENAPCSFDNPQGADVKCGYVIVPEDRTGDATHTIKLAVAVFRSTSSNPAPEPVMFLQGGPGAEAVQLSADAYEYLVLPFLSERDFIVFDQRGTGLSEPALKCDELNKIYLQDIHGLIPTSTRELIDQCARSGTQRLHNGRKRG